MENTGLNSINQIRLQNLNNGWNFFNINKKDVEEDDDNYCYDDEDSDNKNYFIDVKLVIRQTLKEKDEELKVENNLGIGISNYRTELTDFLKQLEEFAKKPFALIRETAVRKDEMKLSHYNELNEISRKIREKTINFSDIKFSIGELAEQKLKAIDIDFVSEVKRILKKQKSDDEIQKKVDEYVRLLEDLKMLKCLAEKKSEYSYYSYSSKPKDETIKIKISAEEYNEKLKEIENKMKNLNKILGLNPLNPLRFDYIEIPKPLDYKKWLKEHEDELRENYEMVDDEEITFDEYAENSFQQIDESEYEDEEFADEECEE